jgi:hypothetical protein
MGSVFSKKKKTSPLRRVLKWKHQPLRHDPTNELYLVRIAIEIRDGQEVLRNFTISEKFDNLESAMYCIQLFGVEPGSLSIDDSETLVIEKILILPNKEQSDAHIQLSCIIREKYIFDEENELFQSTDSKVMLILHDHSVDYDVGIADNISSDFHDIALTIFKRYVAICLGIKSEADFYAHIDNGFIEKAAEKIQNWWYIKTEPT